ncbi:MAG: glycosyltransferase family 39 protein [Anaerolineae bacterium]|nr:glycosyltransferase family 39 protein [Anaerolineae bacterium]
MIATRRRVILLVILLLGVWLRWHALSADLRLHPDEALFSTFARRAALNGEWMLPGALDKPPLSIYAIALTSLPFVEIRPDGLPDVRLRTGELADRLPGAVASILVLPLIYATTRRIYRDEQTALLATALMTVSPFAVAFSATAFTDGLMLFWLVVSLWAIAGGRWGWAGAALALAFASKQQAAFYLPIIIAVGVLRPAFTWRRAAAFSVTLLGGVLLLIAWEGLRAQPAGMFALALANNDPARFIRGEELVPRLAKWLDYANAWYAPATILFAGLGIGGALMKALRRPMRFGSAIDLTFLTYILAYFLLHWLIAFNTYDRYLLPLLPLMTLLAARGGIAFWDWWRVRLPGNELSLAGLICLAVIFGTARDAAEGQINVGGDRGEHQDIDHVAAYLDALPLGAIIYDHWFGWELDYYLGEWSNKRRVYYPDADALVEDALRQPDPAPRYFVADRDHPHSHWLERLEETGFAPQLVFSEARFLVYELTPPNHDG